VKKVLIGAGIGCGLLMVIGGIGAWYMLHKVSGVVASAQKMGVQMQAQEEQMKALDAKYPFTAPANGEPLALSEDRLQAYLAVREAALPIFEDFKKRGNELDAKYKNAGKMEALSGAAEGMGMFTELTSKLRASYAKSLEAQKMGPAEFGAITGAIYASAMGAASAGQREVIKKQLAGLDEKLKTTTDPQMKAALEQQKTMFEQMQTNAPSEKAEAVFVQNAKLTEKYKDRIEKAGNPAFDVFVMQGDSFEKQLQLGSGHHPTAE